MFCEITYLRDKGKRLRESEWPQPVRAYLVFGDNDAKANNYRRNLRCATLYELSGGGTAWRTLAVMADPVILRTVGDGWLLAGLEICVEDSRKHEYSQLWLCRPTHPKALPLEPLDYKRELEKVLPST